MRKILLLLCFRLFPNNLDSEIILESTANGISGKGKFFFDKVNEGLDDRSEWTTLFYPWYEHEEYISEIPADFVTEEAEIKRLYRLKNYPHYYSKIIKATFKQFPIVFRKAF